MTPLESFLEYKADSNNIKSMNTFTYPKVLKSQDHVNRCRKFTKLYNILM